MFLLVLIISLMTHETNEMPVYYFKKYFLYINIFYFGYFLMFENFYRKIFSFYRVFFYSVYWFMCKCTSVCTISDAKAGITLICQFLHHFSYNPRS